MRRIPLPEDEEERLAALREYRILDTLPEVAYDNIAAIASQICGTPIALVSLVDDDRQWFKARVGLTASETSRDLAFCAHAILEADSLMVVENATQDARFANNPLVTQEPRIRFYAGAPLVTSDGHALGTLCVIDQQPRKLTSEQLEALQALSQQVIAQLELRRTLAELEARNRQVEQSHSQLASLCRTLEDQADLIERDLRRAEVIQRSLLPQAAPQLEHFRIRTLYRPGRNVGGDLYDVLEITPRFVAFVIADAAGHGVSAAMLSVLFKHRLRASHERTGEPYSPAEALRHLNAAFRRDTAAPGAFVTAAYCLLDTGTDRITIASAGHCPVLHVTASGETQHLQSTGPALGLNAETEFQEHTLQLATGDRLLLYTDGLLDVGGEPAPTHASVAATITDASEKEASLEEWFLAISRGQEREDRDDVTMLLLEALPGENRCDASGPEIKLRKAPEVAPHRILIADAEASLFLVIEGRVTWLHGQSLLDAADQAIVDQRAIIIDFARCDYLDSTLLGTLHELVERATAAGCPVYLQQVSQYLQDAFSELCMTSVLSRVTPETIAVPREQRSLQLVSTDGHRRQQRLLEAHQVLAGLCEGNREKFAGVLEALRKEIGDLR